MNFKYNKEVDIAVDGKKIKGDLIIPQKAEAIIVFCHGSGSSRLSKRNQTVAKYLHERNFGTLLFDLLTIEEDLDYYYRFDIELLTKRLIAATHWLENLPVAKNCSIGYFGASTGAASALQAATVLPEVKVVVSRGGRPDLVLNYLDKVTAPTLLIVGSLDYQVLTLNHKALHYLKCDKKLETITGATHLFEEKGAMKQVCDLAADWFEKYLKPVAELKHSLKMN